MVCLGKMLPHLANKFVEDNQSAFAGSRTTGGYTRVQTNATGEDLLALRSKFAQISSSRILSSSDSVIADCEDPLPCEHRGSKRNTCCGSPNMWICRELKSDCVATRTDASKLRSMVATAEARSIAVCETCLVRKTPAIARRNTNPRVGLLSAAYMAMGGTETFHQSLLPRLRNVVDIEGFVATAFFGGDGSKLQVPYDTGIEAAEQLAERCDILVVWGISSLATILPASRPKVIAVHHTDWSNDWSNCVILKQLDLIDEIICVNENTASKLATYGKPTHYIPNAINPERLLPTGTPSELRSQFGIPEESKLVIFGHRLSSEKRPQLAVEIAQKLPENWFMVIVGDGPERESVEADAAKCDRVRVIGGCETLADWFAISDCFLSLSTFEGFGLSIGEAMAAGVPTVSTPAGIAPGLATTLPTDSTAKEWADAIVTAKVKVQPAEILDRFSVQRMVDSWASVIKELQ
jgi:glycosyltransferase involved in cell wall biosynthesis